MFYLLHACAPIYVHMSMPATRTLIRKSKVSFDRRCKLCVSTERFAMRPPIEFVKLPNASSARPRQLARPKSAAAIMHVQEMPRTHLLPTAATLSPSTRTLLSSWSPSLSASPSSMRRSPAPVVPRPLAPTLSLERARQIDLPTAASHHRCSRKGKATADFDLANGAGKWVIGLRSPNPQILSRSPPISRASGLRNPTTASQMYGLATLAEKQAIPYANGLVRWTGTLRSDLRLEYGLASPAADPVTTSSGDSGALTDDYPAERCENDTTVSPSVRQRQRRADAKDMEQPESPSLRIAMRQCQALLARREGIRRVRFARADEQQHRLSKLLRAAKDGQDTSSAAQVHVLIRTVSAPSMLATDETATATRMAPVRPSVEIQLCA